MSVSVSWGPQLLKLKTNLGLAVRRLKLLANKKTELSHKARPEIVSYISANKIDRARIRVEHIIREDNLVEAYEMLEMYCDLLIARFGLIENCKHLDDGIAEAVVTILWAAPRIACDIAEFKVISNQLTIKYGRPLADGARKGVLDPPAKVNPRLMEKLSVTTPPEITVERYLVAMAHAAGVSYTPDPKVMAADDAGYQLLGGEKEDRKDAPELGWNMPSLIDQPPLFPPLTPALTPNVYSPFSAVFPTVPPRTPSLSGTKPENIYSEIGDPETPPEKPPRTHDFDFDELARRFERLKRGL